jgi:UDP-2-acetamido-3-amino-2,3-dideoxy-glucuronate N-acetyltransferase
MTFASGIESQVFLSLVEPVKTRMIALIGSEGALVFDEIANPGVMLLYPKQNLPKGWQQTAKDPKEFLRMLGEPEETYGPEISPNEPLNNECRHFLDCLKTHKQPLTGGEEATEVTRLILAALESLSDR